MPAGRPLGDRDAWGPTPAPQPPDTGGVALGVVWGEGMANHRYSTGAGRILEFIERLVRMVYQRLFVQGGEA